MTCPRQSRSSLAYGTDERPMRTAQIDLVCPNKLHPSGDPRSKRPLGQKIALEINFTAARQVGCYSSRNFITHIQDYDFMLWVSVESNSIEHERRCGAKKIEDICRQEGQHHDLTCIKSLMSWGFVVCNTSCRGQRPL